MHNKLSEDGKESINVLNIPENVTLDFIKDDLPPMPLFEGESSKKKKMKEQD